MSLANYNAKRDFTRTSEPKGGKSATGELRFVVQRHHASRLHYDFRLELDGVLKSWAVPKGPSMNPGDKRLAMMVEDHPYNYQYFEGIIPAGEYGGGVVITWDQGTYTSLSTSRKEDVKTLRAGLKSGDLKFRLNGEILKGEFALVKLHKGEAEDNAWLLIKHQDAFAKGKFNSEDFVPVTIKQLKNNKDGKLTQLPKHSPVKRVHAEKNGPASAKQEKKKAGTVYQPMLATLAQHLTDDPDWLYEPKLDGYRAIGYTGKKAAALISRNGIAFNDKYTAAFEALQAMDTGAVVDGEIVLENGHGKSAFQDLQNYDSEKSRRTLRYYLFDLLELNGHDLRELPLIKRKALLKAFLDNQPQNDTVVYLEYTAATGSELLVQSQKEGWEGIIGKDSNSGYESGRRSDRWLKYKVQASQEAVICGYTAPKGSRSHIGSLILGIWQDDTLRYVGNCGTGFDEASLKDLYMRLQPLKTDDKPFTDKVSYHGKVQWVRPELVCEVTFAEWTAEGSMRHPVYKGLRMDKQAEEVVPEGFAQPFADEQTIKVGKQTLRLTNQNKLYWPDEGITKGELLAYYRDLAPHLMPYLKDKPISMRRQPNGISDAGFFQKDTDTAHLPGWVNTYRLYSESNDKDINYIIGRDEATLLYMVNLGCIEINPWLSNYQTPDHPEYLVIDLDPHDVPFSQAVEAALKTKEVFDRLQLPCFVKTSGSKGLHIYCYVGGVYEYAIVRKFAEYLANMIHEELPDTTSIERNPAKRKNKTYIDFLQNRRGQTIAAPYSVRPKRGATVSTPLHWQEVNGELSLSDFTIYTLPDRLKHVADPWLALHAVKADLQQALSLVQPASTIGR
ncbi:DNA ligase D [Mucilaginibacter robiniae]|uniref:DNA ligase (ATP) n=1 Tax=Mucilaginibacter robiniae TaxID=2728022 RepID=A0A7L5E572_9SPHI|nr:DNA ligase D [Mucilaginibacter robiniae]QJD95486.1 DNA ligase D [Mucilaginibacter robiniae]